MDVVYRYKSGCYKRVQYVYIYIYLSLLPALHKRIPGVGWKGFSEHLSQAAALLHCTGTTGKSFWCLVFGNVVALIHREGGCGPQKVLRPQHSPNKR